MGQVINVDVVQTAERDIRQFILNRSLTGMDVREYASPGDATADRADDMLALALFDIPGVATVTITGSVVAVSVVDPVRWDEVEPRIVDVMRNLFVRYDINRV